MTWLGNRCNRTTILMLGCAAFLLGLVAARRIGVSGWLALPALFIAALRFRHKTVATAIAVTVAGLLLGVWRGTDYLRQLQPYQDLARHKVAFTATAAGDAVYGMNSQLSFTVRDVTFLVPADGDTGSPDGQSRQLRAPGTMKVNGFGVPMIYHGDRLRVSGKLYPTRGASQATVSYAELQKLGSGPSVVDGIRRRFAAGLQSALPEPQASFAMGLLVGQRNTLPAALTQALLMVGLTHIIAVSGYNLTILLQAARRLLGNYSKVLSTTAALGLIFGFLLLAGNSASIVRAAVISVLGLSAWYYGRRIRPVLLILLAAAVTTYADPVYIWADLAWYLSFLAFTGILLLAPMVTHYLYGDREPSFIPAILIESICAEVMALPLILYIFGQMSLVSLLANVLVAALIPLAMLLGLVAGLAGMLAGSVSGWLAWPAKLLLTYMVDIVDMLSRIPHVFQENRYLSVLDMAACYGAIVFLLGFAYWRNRHTFSFNLTGVEKSRIV